LQPGTALPPPTGVFPRYVEAKEEPEQKPEQKPQKDPKPKKKASTP
jgi:hypothetical protein